MTPRLTRSLAGAAKADFALERTTAAPIAALSFIKSLRFMGETFLWKEIFIYYLKLHSPVCKPEIRELQESAHPDFGLKPARFVWPIRDFGSALG